MVNDALGDVERNVEQMRNDAVEKRSRISRKQVESIALQLCNVAGRVNEMKEKLLPLERILQKVFQKAFFKARFYASFSQRIVSYNLDWHPRN